MVMALRTRPVAKPAKIATTNPIITARSNVFMRAFHLFRCKFALVNETDSRSLKSSASVRLLLFVMSGLCDVRKETMLISGASLGLVHPLSHLSTHAGRGRAQRVARTRAR